MLKDNSWIPAMITGVVFVIVSFTPLRVTYQKTEAVKIIIEETPPVLTWQEKIEQLPTIKKLAQCESGLNPNATNPKDSDHQPKYGLLQYDADTWILWIAKMEKGGVLPDGFDHNIYNPDSQIVVTKWAISKGYLKHWGCAYKLKLVK